MKLRPILVEQRDAQVRQPEEQRQPEETERPPDRLDRPEFATAASTCRKNGPATGRKSTVREAWLGLDAAHAAPENGCMWRRRGRIRTTGRPS
jgi:hypothetical protein